MADLDLNAAIELAIAEITKPSLAVTRQYLAHHRVVLQDGRPVVAGTEIRPPGDALLQRPRALVYFPIAGHRFFLGVAVQELVDLTVTAVFVQVGSRV